MRREVTNTGDTVDVMITRVFIFKSYYDYDYSCFIKDKVFGVAETVVVI